jgi:hypothetical protein
MQLLKSLLLEAAEAVVDIRIFSSSSFMDKSFNKNSVTGMKASG